MVSRVFIEGEPPEIEDWFETCRQRLHEKWAKTTGHSGSRRGGWACEIYHGCKTCDEHLSLPCSLAMEANEIGMFLNLPCFSDHPIIFFRLYSVLLSEFCDGLRDVAGIIGVKLEKPPKDVSVWCNRFAKHRLCIRIQHHPAYFFADSCGAAWAQFRAELPGKRLVDRCGNRRPLDLIDYHWLADDSRSKNVDLANDERQAIIVVPPMMDLLDSTIRYFRTFVDTCLKESELVKRFESHHFDRACF